MKLPGRQIFPSKGCKIWAFFLLGRITFVGGNSPFPIVGFFISIHPIMRSVNGKSTLALHLSPSLSWRKLNSPTFFFGLPALAQLLVPGVGYRCRDRPNFPWSSLSPRIECMKQWSFKFFTDCKYECVRQPICLAWRKLNLPTFFLGSWR